MFLGTFNAAEMFWYHSRDLYLDLILSRSSMDNSFNLMAWILLCTVNCGTLYRQVCAFPNHVKSIEFTTGGLQSSYRKHLKDDEWKQDAPSSLIAKGLNIFYTFANISKNLFSLCHFGVLCVD